MSKHWIAKAIHHVGGLHKSLGIPQGQKIPIERIRAAAKDKGLLGKRARLALTLEGMPHPSESAEHDAPPARKTHIESHGGGLRVASRS